MEKVVHPMAPEMEPQGGLPASQATVQWRSELPWVKPAPSRPPKR